VAFFLPRYWHRILISGNNKLRKRKMDNPKGWGEDRLSDFIDKANTNILAVFENEPDIYALFSELDDIYHTYSENLNHTPQVIESLLCMRSHSAFRATTRLAISGQVSESYVMGRSCLEYALYAIHMYKKEEAKKIWKKRGESPADTRNCRNEFTVGNIMSSLEICDPELKEIATELYNGTIDYGAHANVRGTRDALVVFDLGNDTVNVKQRYLHGDDSEAYWAALSNHLTIGLCALSILELIWKERFAILNLRYRLEQLNKKYDEVQKQGKLP
jgi:hypothetical protein